MTSVPRNSVSANPQAVCVDLPGETVRCWRSTDKVQVILRKHRDIIFDLKLGGNKKFTVESTGSDFYNADRKKIIAGAGKQRVLFNDGERLHLWVSRDFTGDILLKLDGQVLMKINPIKLDPQSYDSDPKTKPIPIVIALGSPMQAPVHEPGRAQPANRIQTVVPPSRPSSAPLDEECSIVCVVDGDLKGIPADIWQKLKNGGGESGLVDVDPNDVATRNWLLGQVAGAAAYVGDNWEWLRASIDAKTHTGFKLVRAKIHYVRGKARYYFSGYSKANRVFGPGGFGSGHERVLSIFSGAGKTGSAAKATMNGVAGSLKNNALTAFIFGSAASLAEWKQDLSKDGYDLAAALLMNLLKSLVVAGLTSAIVAISVVVAMFLLGMSVSTLAIGVATIAVGIGVTYVVDAADKKLGRMAGGEDNADGLSGIVAKQMRENIEKNWNFLKDKKFWNYEEQWFERSRFD